jgi:putative transposase
VISKVHADNYGVYGARKVHAELRRQGHPVARCTVQRLMRQAGLRGISRAKGPRTTVPGTGPDTRPDLVDRAFRADAPDRLWVADITYCRTFAGWVYAAFVIDVFSRRVVGWQLSTSLRTDLALDALEMGLWTRQHEDRDPQGLIHHSDKGVQYLALRYTQRLAEAGAVASVGSTGDSYDNALAEAFNSLFKAELIRNKGRGRTSTTWRSPSPSTSTGSTTDACTARSARSRPSSTRPSNYRQPARASSSRRVSSEPPLNRHETRASTPRARPTDWKAP